IEAGPGAASSMLFARRGRRGSSGGATSKGSRIRGLWRMGGGGPLFGLVEPAGLFLSIFPTVVGGKPRPVARLFPPIAPRGALFARHSRRMRHFGVKMAGKRAREPEPFVAPPRLSLRTPDRVSGATGAAGWVVKCPSSGSQLA